MRLQVFQLYSHSIRCKGRKIKNIVDTEQPVRYHPHMTPKQSRLLRFIQYKVTTTGIAPTYAEMKSHMEVTSNQTIKDWLNALEKKGFLVIDKGESRGLKLTRLAKPNEITSVLSQIGKTVASTTAEVGVHPALKNEIQSSDNSTTTSNFIYGSYTVDRI